MQPLLSSHVSLVLAEVPYEFQVVMQLGYSFGVIQSCTM